MCNDRGDLLYVTSLITCQYYVRISHTGAPPTVCSHCIHVWHPHLAGCNPASHPTHTVRCSADRISSRSVPRVHELRDSDISPNGTCRCWVYVTGVTGGWCSLPRTPTITLSQYTYRIYSHISRPLKISVKMMIFDTCNNVIIAMRI